MNKKFLLKKNTKGTCTINHFYGESLSAAIIYFNAYNPYLIGINVELNSAGQGTDGQNQYWIEETEIGS